MSFFVYILYSSSLNKHYVGQTQNISERLIRHNAGHERFTKSGLPWVLVWTVEQTTRSDSMKLEKRIKKRGAKRFLENLHKGHLGV